MRSSEIIASLPYCEPFLFVDEITEITKKSCKGHYTFPKDAFYYKGHFKDHPVTPGVILTECMAQIGLVSLGIYLIRDQPLNNLKVAFTSSEMEFLLPVFPEEKVTVVSEIEYFRFNKLKCKIKLYNVDQSLVAQGVLAGIFSLKK